MIRPYSRVYASVNLDAIVSNMKAMKAVLPENTAMMGVVKTDGYGHGAVPVARIMEPYVKGYAAATIDEAIQLRRHGIEKMILILGVTHPSRYEELLRFHIRPAMFQYDKVKMLADLAVKLGYTAKIHLALDTGMGRIGMTPDEKSADMVQKMSRLPGLEIEGIFTHFARADEMDKAAYEAQFQAYKHFMELLNERGVSIPIRHCSNSAGIIECLSSNGLDMVRAGISIYGLYPSDEVDKSKVLLTPAMELKSFITYIKEVQPGSAISYGGTFVAEKPMRVATIPVGYGDGYSRNLSNRGFVLIHGKRAKILGRICMDQFMVDVTDIPQASEDDEVTLLGRGGEEEITAEELARLSGGFHYELLCNISKRVPRVYLRGGEIVGTKDYFEDTYN